MVQLDLNILRLSFWGFDFGCQVYFVYQTL